ncbi:hypothetical protein DL96DRAFT_1678378 [Flagelloscypha sp. PMI_526]|nr:hypothetical protein DL96DRAFT_1678378 [Flagelloscypha sp. PMI_526]
MTTRLPPAYKLSLAVRKNLRDEWEANKDGFDKKVSDLLGVDWSFDFDPLALYPYAEATDNYSKEYFGRLFKQYGEGASWQLENYVNEFGSDGKQEINTICHAHVIQLDVGEPEQINRNYLGCEVRDGKLRILFKEQQFGSNNQWALQGDTLLPALQVAAAKAPDSGAMSFFARMGVSTDYKEIADEAEKKIADLLQNPKLKYEPNFEETYNKVMDNLKKEPDALSWMGNWQPERQFAPLTAGYLRALAYILDTSGYGTDDMLKEGFNESITSNIIKFRVVDTLKRNKYCEVDIEDGVLYLQSSPSTFGQNPDNIGWDLADLL